MYKGKRVGVSIPAYNEETQIGKVLSTMPDFVDRMIVVDDCSKDNTRSVAESFRDVLKDRLIVIRHENNQGVGGAILTGHRRGLAEGMDVMAVMAGDAQMDPADLPRIIDPVVAGKVDYAKGNRFINGEARKFMPKIRFFANAGLSMLNKITSGYWHISDPQAGYTAISREKLQEMDLDRILRDYHFENDMLVHLNVHNSKVLDIPIRAVYGIGEKSGIRYLKALISFSIYLVRGFLWRLKEKYIIRDFHPLIFFYFFGLLFCPTGLVFGLYLVFYRLITGLRVEATSALFATLLFISGLQLLLFAMWFDKDYEKPPYT